MTTNPPVITTIHDAVHAGTPDGWPVNVTGIISKTIERVTVDDGRPWVTFYLTDATGSAEVLVFPDTFAKFNEPVVDGAQITLHCVTQDPGHDQLICVADPSKPCLIEPRDHIAKANRYVRERQEFWS